MPQKTWWAKSDESIDPESREAARFLLGFALGVASSVGPVANPKHADVATKLLLDPKVCSILGFLKGAHRPRRR